MRAGRSSRATPAWRSASPSVWRRLNAGLVGPERILEDDLDPLTERTQLTLTESLDSAAVEDDAAGVGIGEPQDAPADR